MADLSRAPVAYGSLIANHPNTQDLSGVASMLSAALRFTHDDKGGKFGIFWSLVPRDYFGHAISIRGTESKFAGEMYTAVRI
jgi:hypothetical protein